MFFDDRSAYPMCSFIRLGFSGRFDRESLETALRRAVVWHPLLVSRIHRTSRNKLQWVADPDGPRPIRWLTGSPENHYPPFDCIDITAECGLRLAVVEYGETSDLIMQTHHACCDGMGMYQFLEELFSQYALAAGLPPLPEPVRPDHKALAQRGSFGLTPLRFIKQLPKLLVGLDGVRKFLLRTPSPLTPAAPPAAIADLPADYPNVINRQLSAAELHQLRKTASSLGVTVNDLLIHDLFAAIDAWQGRYFPEYTPGWLRLCVPIDLRSVSGLAISAANVVSLVFLDRRREEISNRRAFLSGIHKEMQLIKRLSLGLIFPLSLNITKALPGGIARQTNADRCQSSCVFSNHGGPLKRLANPFSEEPFRLGNLQLETIELVPTLRPYNQISFAAVAYAGKLFISAHYDSRIVSPEIATALMDGFIDCLRHQSLPADDRF